MHRLPVVAVLAAEAALGGECCCQRAFQNLFLC